VQCRSSNDCPSGLPICNPITATCGPCETDADCAGNRFGPRCQFPPGICTADVDECALHTDACDPNAICTNTVDSYSCTCKPGFTGDGFTCQAAVHPRLECVMADPLNPATSLALFGYENTTSAAADFAIGTDNQVSLNGPLSVPNQPTSFTPGIHPFVFGVRFVPGTDVVSWTLIGQTLNVGADATNCGVPGPTGPTGPQGVIGDAGPQGPIGSTGAGGPSGPSGSQGPQGFTGGLGVTGPSGPQGARGPSGPSGPTGQSGQSGAVGSTGPTGATGANGAGGPTGPSGSQGPQGLMGSPGLQGPSGATGPAGAGLSFVTQILNDSGAVALPPGNTSVVVLVSAPPRDVQVQLPAAASAAGRFVTVRRLDSDRRVFVVPLAGETVRGASRGTLTLENRFEGVTLISDGTSWIVFDAR
jgi:hypothetical protein